MSHDEDFQVLPPAPSVLAAAAEHEAHAGVDHRSSHDPVDEPAWPADDDAPARPFVEAPHRTAPASHAVGRHRPLVWIGLAAMAALSGAAGYEMLKPASPQRLEAGLAAGQDRDEPVSVSTSLPRVSEPAAAAMAMLATASSTVPAAPTVPASAALVVTSTAAVVPHLTASAALAPSQSRVEHAPTAASAPVAPAGNAQAAFEALTVLQARLNQLTTALRDQGYLKPGTRLDDLASDALLPYPGGPKVHAPAAARPGLASVPATSQARRPGARGRSRVRFSAHPRARGPVAPVVPLAAAPSQPTPSASAASATGVQLMAVDLWNGTPSVVIGTTTPGDARIKVMQPGDVINGVQLRHAQADGQRATFGVRGSADAVSLVVGQ